MRYAHIIRKLYAEPLLIEQSAWRAFDHALRDVMQRGKITMPQVGAIDLNRPGGSGEPPLPADDPDEIPIDDPPATQQLPPRVARVLSFPSLDTALIAFDGVIDKHVAMLDLMCYGGVDLDDIDAALEIVRKDDIIKNILLFFNSPGGSVIGVPETAAKVAQLAALKNVKSFSDSCCCSAAYFIASQAGEVFFTSSTYSGSIGVLSPPIIDISRMLKAEGVTVTTIKSGEYKDTGSMFRPVTDDEIAMLQARCDKIYGMFTDAVTSARRGVSNDAMQGQVFFGDEAVAVGLADAVMPDLAAALAQF